MKQFLHHEWSTHEEEMLSRCGVAPEELRGVECSKAAFRKLYDERKLILQIVVSDETHAQVLEMGGTYPASGDGNLMGMDPTGFFVDHPWPRKRGLLLQVQMDVPSVWDAIMQWECDQALDIPMEGDVAQYDASKNGV